MITHSHSFLHDRIEPEQLIGFSSRSSGWRQQLQALCFFFCVITCFVLIFLQAAIAFYPDRRLSDYGSFYAAGSLANLHLNPYQDHPLVNHIREFDRHGPETPLQGTNVDAVNLNPPIVVLPFKLLARLDPMTGRLVWSCISAIFLIASLLLIVRPSETGQSPARLLWILALPAIWQTFQLGQIYTVLFLAAALAWRFLRSQKFWAAGMAIGFVCAVKPNFFIWPLLLLLGRSRKAGLSAFATAAALTGASLLGQGPEVYRQWIEATRAYNGFELAGNASLLATFSRAGLPGVGIAVTVGMLLAAIIWALVAKPDSMRVSEAAILAALFAGPLSWAGYTMLLLPFLYSRPMDTWMRAGCVLLCVPVWIAAPVATVSRVAYILFEGPSIYGLLLLAFGVVANSPRREVEFGEVTAAGIGTAAPPPTYGLDPTPKAQPAWDVEA